MKKLYMYEVTTQDGQVSRQEIEGLFFVDQDPAKEKVLITNLVYVSEREVEEEEQGPIEVQPE
jgi:hypothetical protein